VRGTTRRARSRQLAVAALFAFLGLTYNAQAADRLVSTLGSDSANDCLTSTSPCRTVGYALSQAGSGDTVKVAAGLYLENLSVSTPMTLALSGGWSADFTTQDPATTPTTLRAAVELPVLSVVANGISVDFTADGLTIERGRNFLGSGGACSEARGGGICADVKSGGDLTIALSRLVVQRNRALGGGGGFGADVFGSGSSLSLTVTDSSFIKNQANFGGGLNIFTDQTPLVDATLDGVRFVRNLGGNGGGFGIGQALGPLGQNAQVLIRNSLFDSNRAIRRLAFPGGGGGGIFAVNTGCSPACPLRIENTVFIRNRAVAGGGLSVTAGLDPFGFGGAELVGVTATLNVARGTLAAGGGGAVMQDGTILDSILWANGGHPPGISPWSVAPYSMAR
jgi:hypothetical protein